MEQYIQQLRMGQFGDMVTYSGDFWAIYPANLNVNNLLNPKERMMDSSLTAPPLKHLLPLPGQQISGQ